MQYHKLSQFAGDVFFDLANFRYVRNITEDNDVGIAQYKNPRSSRLKKLVLLVTNHCNLSCSYCIAGKGTYTANTGCTVFEPEVLLGRIRSLLTLYPEGISYIQLFGGEPLLALSKLEPLLAGIRSLFDRLSLRQPKFSVVTNGMLITPEVAALFRRYQIYTTVSLDGIGAIHDATRNRRGECTYQTITNNLKLLASQQLTVEFSVTHVLIGQYQQGLIAEILSEYISLGFRNIVLNIIYSPETIAAAEQHPQKLDDLLHEYTDFMIAELHADPYRLSDYAISNAFITVLRKKAVRHTCTAGVGSLTLTTDGQLQSCYLSEQVLAPASEWDLTEIAKKLEAFQSVEAPDVCRTCWCQKLCTGWCREMLHGNVYSLKCRYINIYLEKVISDVLKGMQDKAYLQQLVQNIKRFGNN